MPASCRAFAWHAFFHARVFFFLPFLSAAHVFNVVIQAAIAPGFHLFPSRTEKLSPAAPMVLRHSGRVGRRLFFERQSPALPVVVGRGIAFSDAPPAARSARPSLSRIWRTADAPSFHASSLFSQSFLSPVLPGGKHMYDGE